MNINLETFFDENGNKKITDVPITFNDLYAAIKHKKEVEDKEQFEKSWERLLNR